MTYTKEIVIEIWDNATGDHFEVGPDRDALDMIEVRQYIGSAHECARRFAGTKEEMKLLGEAILEACGVPPNITGQNKEFSSRTVDFQDILDAGEVLSYELETESDQAGVKHSRMMIEFPSGRIVRFKTYAHDGGDSYLKVATKYSNE